VKFTYFKLLLTPCLLAAALTTQAIESAKPEALGFSSERLQRLDQAMTEKINTKQLAGAVTLLARHGKAVSFNTYGHQDIANAREMRKDTIFRIYSMTKPITSVAMMILYEEGKWLPNDPVAKYLPEFKDLKVYAGQDKNGNPILVSPNHQPTIHELLTHTAGFALGFFDTPVDKLYANANLWGSNSLKEFVDKVAALPLKYQPGEAWDYSVSADLVGYLIERLSGQSLPDFFEQRIFKPLGMKDTAFLVPEQKLSRLAITYQPSDASPLSPMPLDPKISSLPGFVSAGGGLYSTADDFFNFAQMLLNNGKFKNVQLLSPASVKLMRSNHLPEKLQTGKHGIGFYRMQPGFGFGYNVAVIEEPLKVGSTAGAGSYLWDGLAGTWFWIDPANDVIFIGLIQRWALAPNMPNLEDWSRALVYQALLAPQK
jgi:CubicO group peptidase (beta-lactamase class C family)